MINVNNISPVETDFNDFLPDLTPMLDILFILLVFFMLTAGAVFQSLDLTLPSSVAEELSLLQEPKHITLEIRQDGYAVDGKQVQGFNELKLIIPSVIKQKKGYDLIVAGDKGISIERFLKVLTYLQSQGILAASILMQKETTE